MLGYVVIFIVKVVIDTLSRCAGGGGASVAYFVNNCHGLWLSSDPLKQGNQ